MECLIDIKQRLQYGQHIRNIFLDDNKDIFTNIKCGNKKIPHTKKNLFQDFITKHLGQVGGSIDAEAYKVRFKNDYNAAIKFCPLTKDENNNKLNYDYKVWKELEILKIIFNILQQNITPNLPVIYLYFVCNDMTKKDYSNPNIRKFYNNKKIRNSLKEKITDECDNRVQVLNRMIRKKDYGLNCLCIINELCDFTIKDLITDHKLMNNIDDYKFKSFMFQIITGIYAYNKHGNIAHFDLHGNNILISNINSGKHWNYHINNNTYYIPNYGYSLKIWDFGRSYIIGKDTNEVIITQLKSQMIRFMEQLFNEDPNLKNDIYNVINDSNINLICFCFDLWRITSYVYTKINKIPALSYKYSDTLKLLNSIQKICQKNWISALINRNISNSLDNLVNTILHNYFKSYLKNNSDISKKDIINSKCYNL